MRPWKPALATIPFAMILAGCGTPEAPPVADGRPGAEAYPVVEPTCPASDPHQLPEDSIAPHGSGGVPQSFVTAWVLRCRSDLRDKPGQGKWTVQVAERADAPATELVAELRRPSDPLTNAACTMELVVPPYFVLVDAAGKGVAPAVPTDQCGKPRREALAALDKLAFRVISETPVNQVRSPRSVESGCSDTFKDMLTIEADRAKPAPARPAFEAPVGSLRVCLYERVVSKRDQVGSLLAARGLDGDAAKNLVAALDKAGPAAGCAVPYERFAVLSSPDNVGGFAVAELDGCHRLLRSDGTLGQLDEATVALVSAR